MEAGYWFNFVILNFDPGYRDIVAAMHMVGKFAAMLKSL